MQSAYDTYRPGLIELGYSYPRPVIPGTKLPGYSYPNSNKYLNMTDWTNPNRPIETLLQPGAGICVLLGKQACGNYLIAIDWDLDEAALVAMERFPYTVTKEGAKGFTAFFRASIPIPSQDFKIGGRAAVQVLSDGRQTVLPPTIHPDIKRPYQWTSKFTLFDTRFSELPELPL